jgi:hypothetical protein
MSTKYFGQAWTDLLTQPPRASSNSASTCPNARRIRSISASTWSGSMRYASAPQSRISPDTHTVPLASPGEIRVPLKISSNEFKGVLPWPARRLNGRHQSLILIKLIADFVKVSIGFCKFSHFGKIRGFADFQQLLPIFGDLPLRIVHDPPPNRR